MKYFILVWAGLWRRSLRTILTLLSVIGALIGAAIAWALFSGTTINMGSLVSSIVFRLQVSVGLVAQGILWACAVGLFGGLLPAIRAARLPVATAIRGL